MGALLNELRERGCDVDAALARFAHQEALYARYYGKFIHEDAFAALGAALRAKDADTAFEHARALKEMAANLGIAPLSEMAAELMEPLRAGLYSDALLGIYDRLMKEMAAYHRIGARSGL